MASVPLLPQELGLLQVLQLQVLVAPTLELEAGCVCQAPAQWCSLAANC